MATDNDIPTEQDIQNRSYEWGHETGKYVPAAHPEYKRRRDSEEAHEKRMANLKAQASDLREQAETKVQEGDALAVEDDPGADALYDEADELRAKAERIERKVEAKKKAFDPCGISVEEAKDEARQKARARKAELYENELIPAVEDLKDVLDDLEDEEAETSTIGGKGLTLSRLKMKAKTGSKYSSLHRYQEDLQDFVERHG